MSAVFSSASTQRITTPSSLSTPFTIGCWVRPNQTATAGVVWSLSDTGTTNNYWRFAQNAATEWLFQATAGGAAATSSVGGAPSANLSYFSICRAIDATNRWVSLLLPNGSSAHVQNTTARAPAGIDILSVGSFESSNPGIYFDGAVAELWFTNTDIQAGGVQLQDSLLRQLAYGGPFSVPYIAKDIIDYRSLRTYPASNGDGLGEVHFGALGRQVWTNVNGVTIGPHPPLPYWYVKPGQTQRALVI